MNIVIKKGVQLRALEMLADSMKRHTSVYNSEVLLGIRRKKKLAYKKIFGAEFKSLNNSVIREEFLKLLGRKKFIRLKIKQVK